MESKDIGRRLGLLQMKTTKIRSSFTRKMIFTFPPNSRNQWRRFGFFTAQKSTLLQRHARIGSPNCYPCTEHAEGE